VSRQGSSSQRKKVPAQKVILQVQHAEDEDKDRDTEDDESGEEAEVVKVV
jgi:hypothetical protein